MRKTYRPKVDYVSKKIQNEDSSETLIVAELDAKAVGAVNIKVIENRLHLKGLGVLDDYRNRGVCKLMIEFMIKKAQKLNLRCLSLYTIMETGNVAAFEKVGFKTISIEIADCFVSKEHDSLHEVYMEMRL